MKTVRILLASAMLVATNVALLALIDSGTATGQAKQAPTNMLYPQLDPDTQVTFGIVGANDSHQCRRRAPDQKRYFELTVMGELPPKMDLRDQDLVRLILKKGLEYALATCGEAIRIHVSLYDPQAKSRWAQATYERSDGFSKVYSYLNSSTSEAQKGEEEKRLTEVVKELHAFLDKYSTQKYIPCRFLATNPFAVEGEVVVVQLRLGWMLDRDKAAFGSGGECLIVASAIPPRTFSLREVPVVLAGRVVGVTQVPSWPLPVPHLKFMEIYFCREQDCGDFTRAWVAWVSSKHLRQKPR